ncbi:MAG: M36 family metallopeptidase, partial [Phycisphaerales bacterium]
MKVHTNERISQGGGRLRLVRMLAIAGAAAGLVAFSSLAAGAAGTEPQNINEKFADYGPGLPPVDIRTDAGGAPVAAVVQAREAWAASPSGRGVTAAEEALKTQFPSLRSYRDPALGSVKWLGATADFLTPASPAAVKASPTQVVKDFMAAHPALFEVGPALLDQSIQVRNFETPGANMTHLTWQQTIGGVRIENARLNASVTADGRLINIGGTLLPEPIEGFATTKFSLSETQAIHAAALACGVTIAADPVPTGKTTPNGDKVWTTPEELRQDEAVLTRQIYFAVTRTDIRAAYAVLVPIRGVGHWYELIVDAETGQMLTRQNFLMWDTTEPATYRVYISDSPSPSSPGTQTPSGMQFPFVPRQSVTIQPGDISAINPNGWIPDGGTSTLGNNVDGYIDAANDNAGSPADRATSATRNFDFALPTDVNNMPTAAPATYRDAAITQLFYLANNYHDRLWLMGFNEAAGNFQTDNFGRGGNAGDFVHAECQDGGGTNNANFGTTSSDGSTGRMQMYIFTGPNPDRDGSLDGDVVYHELSHGLSIRLHGPAGGLGSGTQSGGMGEGWGDFFGICLNAEAGDDFSQTYSTGAYATRDFGSEGT